METLLFEESLTHEFNFSSNVCQKTTKVRVYVCVINNDSFTDQVIGSLVIPNKQFQNSDKSRVAATET